VDSIVNSECRILPADSADAADAADASSAVTITSPPDGLTVSGTVKLNLKLGPEVWWTWLFIDGKPGPSGYNPLIWNSTNAAPGNHTLVVRAFPRNSSRALGSNSISVIVSSSTARTTYYVDNVKGLDANNGTSSSTPWQTLTKVATILPRLKPGDSVLFAQGSTFVASGSRPMINVPTSLNGLPGKPITFGVYGSGPQPVFDGNHLATACFDGCAVEGESCAPASHNVPLWSYLTVEGIECKNTSAIGIGFKQQSSKTPVAMPGLIIQNNYVHDTGVYPDDGNYNNQIELLDYAYTADGIQVLNNTIERPGGHNGLQIHGDAGSALIQGNTCIGPWGTIVLTSRKLLVLWWTATPHMNRPPWVQSRARLSTMRVCRCHPAM
jgi:hypothetical protein